MAKSEPCGVRVPNLVSEPVRREGAEPHERAGDMECADITERAVSPDWERGH
jgi:hypothetical protein